METKTYSGGETGRNKLEVIVEKKDELLWGRVEIGGHLFTPYGETIEKLLENLQELITDHTQNEGKAEKVFAKLSVTVEDVEIKYDLEAFFMEHNYLKISSIAEQAGINPGLVRQYASGVKHPSAEQAKKIEAAIHKIGNNLLQVQIYA